MENYLVQLVQQERATAGGVCQEACRILNESFASMARCHYPGGHQLRCLRHRDSRARIGSEVGYFLWQKTQQQRNQPHKSNYQPTTCELGCGISNSGGRSCVTCVWLLTKRWRQSTDRIHSGSGGPRVGTVHSKYRASTESTLG